MSQDGVLFPLTTRATEFKQRIRRKYAMSLATPLLSIPGRLALGVTRTPMDASYCQSHPPFRTWHVNSTLSWMVPSSSSCFMYKGAAHITTQ
jgi:hypothetical protein